MSPDTPETRIRVMEQIVAALKQEVHDLGEDVRVFAPMVVQMATMTAHVEHVERSVADLTKKLEERDAEHRAQIKELHDKFDSREREQRTESVGEKRFRITISVALLVAVLGILVQIYLAANA